MPLQKFEPKDIPDGYYLTEMINTVIDYCNALEQRLADLEKKTETILMVKEKYNSDFNSGCAKCGKVLLDGKCLDCK